MEPKEITVKVNPKIYSLDCVYSATYVLMDKAFFVIDGDPEKEILIKVTPKKSIEADMIEKDIFEQLLNYKHYHTNLEKNKDITRLIIEKALFTANTKLVEEAEEQEIQDLLKELDLEDDKEIKQAIKGFQDEPKSDSS